MKKRHFLQSLVLGAAGLPCFAQAQEFPARPVRIVVPFPPGGGTDVIARAVALRLQEQWKQPVIVENRSGAGGMVGAELVYRAAPDGHTLLLTAQQTLVSGKLFNPRLNFDPGTLEPVGVVSLSTVAMFASPKVPADTLQQFVAHARENPGKLNFASTGPGSTAQLAGELLKLLTRTQMVEVPYQGVAPAFVALMGGEVDVLFDSVANGIQHVQAGKLKVLGLAAERRLSELPNVPTMAEVVPGFSAPLWVGVAAPPRTPPTLCAQIARSIADACRHPDIAKLVHARPGNEVVGGEPGQMAALMKAEREQWAGLIRTTGLKVE